MRFRIVLALCAGLALCACNLPGGVPPAPASVADQTKVDEQAALSVELAYQSAVLAVRTANRAGLLSPADRARAAELDTRAYAAVQAVRAAYEAGNAASYRSAVESARSAIAGLVNALGEKQ